MPETFELTSLDLPEETEVPGFLRQHPECTPLRFHDSECLITAGERCDHIFLLLKGSCNVSSPGEDSAATTPSMAILDAQPHHPVFIGEMAYFSRQPRSATVRSCMTTWVLKLEPRHLESIIAGYPQLTRRLCQQFSDRLKEMNKLVERFQALHSLKATTLFLEPGAVLFAPGDAPDTLYQLADGKVRESLTGDDDRLWSAHAEEPALVGARAYFTQQAHTSAAVAETAVIALGIPVACREAAARTFPTAVLSLLQGEGTLQ